MTLEELKRKIISKELITFPIVFQVSDTDFIPHQYIKQIRSYMCPTVEWIEDLTKCILPTTDIFGAATTDKSLLLYKTETLECSDTRLKSVDNLIIICNKLTDEASILFSNCLIIVPKLEHWQIQDYVYSLGAGIDRSYLDNLIELCKWDMFRIEQEMMKISLFDEVERKSLFEGFMYDGVFSDLSKYQIFDFSTCVIKKDLTKLAEIYAEIDRIDIEPIGLVTVLMNNFKNIISVQLHPSPSPESCGLPAKQFWAVKYSCGYYNKAQLVKIYTMLTSIDRRLKMGNLPAEYIIDYIVTFILNV